MQRYQQVQVNNISKSFTNSFTLENGLEQLKSYFSQLSISRYEDNLHVTELEPIMAYIRSGFRVMELSEDEIINLQLGLETELKEKGSIFITKDSALFEAIK